MRAGVVVAIGLVLAVTSVGSVAHTARHTPPNPALARFYHQQLTWQSCAAYVELADERARCAWVRVPLDYARPSGQTIEIAISRIPASGKRKGALVFLQGGPGYSGLWLADQARDTEVAQRFDRIGIDPRGIGASRPAVRCVSHAEIDEMRAELPIPNTPTGIAHAEADARDYVDACLAENTPDLLAHIGTREGVQDLDIVRAVLDEEKLTAVGYSYGTFTATMYAERFPDRVRALVLDGAVDPSLPADERMVAQIASFQSTFDAFAVACTRLAVDCPLGDDEARANDVLRHLLSPLLAASAPTLDHRGLSYYDAEQAIIGALYRDANWELLTDALRELRDGRGDLLLKLADWQWERRPDGTYPGHGDAGSAISCVDNRAAADRASRARVDAAYRRAAPFLDDGRATGQAPRDVCAFWPVPATLRAHPVDIKHLPPTVVVSTTGDPATPHAEGIALAKQLNARLLTFSGWQHTVVFDGNVCIDYAVTRYLVDLVLPPPDIVCG
ncbi:protease [Nocardia camponoti]|uniref:Protease n=1 Tax=Nocardia camponoti TaxID=1616106 RepID=A0A917QAF6_9NOCA|nr:protease [Nocardia camponoti]